MALFVKSAVEGAQDAMWLAAGALLSVVTKPPTLDIELPSTFRPFDLQPLGCRRRPSDYRDVPSRLALGDTQWL